jgi:glycosyltransferase involved in cell wall biosynthesis
MTVILVAFGLKNVGGIATHLRDWSAYLLQQGQQSLLLTSTEQWLQFVDKPSVRESTARSADLESPEWVVHLHLSSWGERFWLPPSMAQWVQDNNALLMATYHGSALEKRLSQLSQAEIECIRGNFSPLRYLVCATEKNTQPFIDHKIVAQNKVAVIPPLVKIHQPPSNSHKNIYPRLADHYPKLLICGGLHTFYGSEFLLQCLPFVLERWPQALMVFAGAYALGEEEKYEKKCQSLKEHVYFAGGFSHPEMLGLMDVCDVFIRATRAESYGLSVIEAAALQKPILLSSIEQRKVLQDLIPYHLFEYTPTSFMNALDAALEQRPKKAQATRRLESLANLSCEQMMGLYRGDGVP